MLLKIIIITSAVLEVLLGGYVWKKYPRKAVAITFFVFTVTVAYWAINNILEANSPAFFWVKNNYASGTLMSPAALAWLLCLLNKQINKLKVFFIYLSSIVLFIICYIDGVIIQSVERSYIGGFDGKLGYLYPVYVAYSLGIILYILIRLYLEHRRAIGIRKTQLKYVAMGIYGFALVTAFVSLILPLFNISHYTPLDSPSAFIFIGFTIYAIIRYRLFNIRFAITRSLLFSILVTIIGTAITFGLILINKFINIESTRNSLIANLFIAAVIVLCLNPLKNRLAKITDAIFFKDQVDPQEILRLIGAATAKDLKLEELLAEFSALFQNLIKLKKVQILIGDTRGNHFALFNPTNNHNTANNHNHQPANQTFTAPPDPQLKNDYKTVVDYFTQNPEIKVTEEEERRAQDLKDGPRKTELSTIVKALNNIDMELVIPVSVEIKSESAELPWSKEQAPKRLVNAIILTGAKVNGEIFDNRDIKLFTLLAAQLATAVEKSKLYERVRHFNLELRKKIKIATEELEQANINLKDANKELKQLDKAKSLFLSIAAHQLRTPLTGIKGYISMFLEGDFGPLAQKQTEIMKGLFSSSNRLTRLINTFLNVSRIEAGRLRLDKSLVDLKELGQTVLSDLKEVADDKNLKLELDAPEKIEKVLIDKDKIEDVLLNLTDNAIKYTQAGQVVLRLRQLGGKIRVEVQDTGIGISKKETAGLFNKFVRGKKALKLHTDGAGLGLFIVKKLVEAHGGQVGVESAGQGKGSIFWFEVPMEDSSNLKTQS